VQLEEQEKQVALLRARIALLEGGEQVQQSLGGNSVDDFSIKVKRCSSYTTLYN
jgi:hypothetical protein